MATAQTIPLLQAQPTPIPVNHDLPVPIFCHFVHHIGTDSLVPDPQMV